jgi:seryl-tRNA synthetase
MAEVAGLGDALKRERRCPTRCRRLDAWLLGDAEPAARKVPAGARRTTTSRSAAGAPRAPFAFPPKDHVDLGEPLGLDFETAPSSPARASR